MVPSTRSEVFPTGEYVVVVNENVKGKTVRGVARVAVVGTDLAVNVPLGPSPSVAGRVDCRGAALAFFDPVQVARVQATIQADGTFVTPPVNPGVYSVFLNSRDCYLHRLMVGGQPLPGHRLTVGADPIADLVVETRSDAGSLHGFLRRGELAQPGVKVYLAPVPWDESRPARQFLTDSDGSFDFERLPPGQYMVYLAPDAPELFEYGNPEAVAPYRQNATVVEVAPKQRVRLDLAWPGAANGQVP
jgi:hypothetical protein